jgi:hypothetical protein
MINKIFDIECYPNYFLVVTRDVETGKYHDYTLENRLYVDLIYNPNVNLIGWNNHNYDNLLLNYIAQNLDSNKSGWSKVTNNPVNEQSLHDLSNRIINGSQDDEYLKQLKFDDTIYSSQDIKALLDPIAGLKKVEMRTGFWNVQDLPVPPDTILTDEEKEVVRQYCHNDVDATYEQYKGASEALQLRNYLAKRFNLDSKYLRSASEPRTAEYILSREAASYKNTSPWRIKEKLQLSDAQSDGMVHVKDCIPGWIKFKTETLQELLQDFIPIKLPRSISSGYVDGKQLKRRTRVGAKDYQLGVGGLHSIDAPEVRASANGKQIIDADVTSYYPSILLRDKLYPRGYDHHWNQIYQQIYTDRLKAKKNPDKSIEAYALKIILNATFGKFGSQYSSFYDPTLLLRVTITGQLALLMLIEACTEQEIEVISANTDGILVEIMDHQMDSWHSICNWWQDHTKFDLEYTQYQRYARRDVNSYTALTTDGKVKNKGIFTPPDLKHDVQAPVIQKMTRNYLLYNEEPVINREELCIHDFIFHFGANKSFDIYLNDTPLSKSNRWYVGPDTLNNKLVKRGGKLGNTISVPNGSNIVLCNKLTDDSIPNDLNEQYYLDKAWELITNITG